MKLKFSVQIIIIGVIMSVILGVSQRSFAAIAGAEYFVDNDPGKGQGVSIAAPDDGVYDSNKESVTVELDTTSLSIGYHTVYIRFMNDSNVWGLARPLGNDRYTAPRPNIRVDGDLFLIGAEYFIDEDPGEGNGVSLDAKDGLFDESVEDIDATGINVSELSEGMHTAYLRMQDSNGNWGDLREFSFEVFEAGNIDYAEYYFDTDPGERQGNILEASSGSFGSRDISFDSDISTSGLEEGVHSVCIRIFDNVGRADVRCSIFTVGEDDGILPVRSYSFDKETDASYQNETGLQLIDGKYGSDTYNADLGNGAAYEWLGWKGVSPVNIDFDFGSPSRIDSINIGSIQDSITNIVLPSIEIYRSQDGVSWTFVKKLPVPESDSNNGKHKTFEIDDLEIKAARYVRVKLLHSKDGPWTFIDEVDFFQTSCSDSDMPEAVSESIRIGDDEKSVSGQLKTSHDDKLENNSDDDDNLVYEKGSKLPKKGILKIDAVTGKFTYTPFLGASGRDSFTFMASNGCKRSNEATITVYFGGDSDGDGFTIEDNDCDDNDSSINPEAQEYYYDIDRNCDGKELLIGIDEIATVGVEASAYTPGQPYTITVTPGENIIVVLYYRQKGSNDSYKFVKMTNNGNDIFENSISSEYITNAGIEFYISLGEAKVTDLFDDVQPVPTINEWGMIFLMAGLSLTVFYKRDKLNELS